MKLVSRNFRGLGNQPAARGLSDLVKAEEPDIIFLSETKMIEKEIEWFQWKLNLTNMIVVDSNKRSGGFGAFLAQPSGCETKMEGLISHRCGCGGRQWQQT